VLKVVARCHLEEGCPLYHSGDGLEFSKVAVNGLDFVPVCSKAVINLMNPVNLIRNGEPARNHEGTFCGGCEEGRAWFVFTADAAVTSYRVAPQFESFALNALGKMKLFSGVRRAILERVVPFLRERRVDSGEIILRRGDAAVGLFIIVLGHFDVFTYDEQGVQNQIATLSTGDCFGEMSLITGEAVSANVIAREPGSLLEIPKDNFQRLLSVVPPLGATLARILAQRLAKASTSIVEELKKGLLGRLDMVPPAELMQAMNVNSQTGQLSVRGEKGVLTMYIENGQVFDVQGAGLTGDEAFYDFLKWPRGNFRFETGKRDIARVVQSDTISLLLEGVRRIDEARASRGPSVTAIDDIFDKPTVVTPKPDTRRVEAPPSPPAPEPVSVPSAQEKPITERPTERMVPANPVAAPVATDGLGFLDALPDDSLKAPGPPPAPPPEPPKPAPPPPAPAPTPPAPPPPPKKPANPLGLGILDSLPDD